MSKTIHALIDRIEGDVAVLLLGDSEEDEVHIPRKYLPANAGEGSALNVSLEVDRKASLAAREEAARLIRKLQKGL